VHTDASPGPRALAIEHLDRRWLVQPGPRTVVGRSAQCDITIDHHLVSRLHLELSWVDGSWQARDLQSANGTHVDGSPATAFMIDSTVTVVLGGSQGAVLTMEPQMHGGIAVAPVPFDDQPTVEGPPPRPNFAREAPNAAIPIVDPSAHVAVPGPAPAAAGLPATPAPIASSPASFAPDPAPVAHRYDDDPPPRAHDRVDGIAPPPGESLSGPVGSVQPAPSPVSFAPPSNVAPPPALPPADWYPDPDDPARLRYWDGYQWTDHWHPPRH
jgi:hypothetical protein